MRQNAAPMIRQGDGEQRPEEGTQPSLVACAQSWAPAPAFFPDLHPIEALSQR
jgi:hypothetical protein